MRWHPVVALIGVTGCAGTQAPPALHSAARPSATSKSATQGASSGWKASLSKVCGATVSAGGSCRYCPVSRGGVVSWESRGRARIAQVWSGPFAAAGDAIVLFEGCDDARGDVALLVTPEPSENWQVLDLPRECAPLIGFHSRNVLLCTAQESQGHSSTFRGYIVDAAELQDSAVLVEAIGTFQDACAPNFKGEAVAIRDMTARWAATRTGVDVTFGLEYRAKEVEQKDVSAECQMLLSSGDSRMLEESLGPLRTLELQFQCSAGRCTSTDRHGIPKWITIGP